MSPREAAWRPGRGRHNIWELVVHARTGIRGLAPAHIRRSRFVSARRLQLVRASTEDTLKAWRRDIALLEQTHRTLRAAIAELNPRDLDRAAARSKVTMRAGHGVAAHDLYHAGQIQLLKRLAPR